MKEKKDKIVVGITHGDINGIGYEIMIKTLMDQRITEFCTPIVYGSPKAFAFYRKQLGIENFSLNLITKPSEANAKRPNIINCMDDSVKVEAGQSTKQAGDGAVAALHMAVKDMKSGEIDVLLTAPINKKNVQSDKYNFPGHTEYLAAEYNTSDYLMIMVSDVMKIGVATGHIPLRNVPSAISKELILKKLEIMNQSLIQDFVLTKPKIAVFGLNPHCGDDGLIGNEEKEIIAPAIEEAKNRGIMAFGPYSADGFFGSDAVRDFDAILAMYHDQGMIAFKAMAFDTGVNYTAGLPIVRTSPAHGTAYEIAGKNIAHPDSFRSALYMVCDLYKNRKQHKELTANPLKKAPADLGNEKESLQDLKAEKDN